MPAHEIDPRIEEALAEAVRRGWTPDEANDALFALLQEVEAQGAVDRFYALSSVFVSPWRTSIRLFVERHRALACDMRANLAPLSEIRSVDVAVDAICILARRKLGMVIREGFTAFRPLNGLVAVLRLDDETLDMISPYAVAGQTRTPGWFVGRVVVFGDIRLGLRTGDKVLVEAQSAPYGAGWIESEEFGLDPGGHVVFVPCRRLPSPPRSEELVERWKANKAFELRYPTSKYPQDHSLWSTPEGQAVLAEMGSNIEQIRQILDERKGKARNRLVSQKHRDTTKPEGILAVLPDPGFDRAAFLDALPDGIVRAGKKLLALCETSR